TGAPSGQPAGRPPPGDSGRTAPPPPPGRGAGRRGAAAGPGAGRTAPPLRPAARKGRAPGRPSFSAGAAAPGGPPGDVGRGAWGEGRGLDDPGVTAAPHLAGEGAGDDAAAVVNELVGQDDRRREVVAGGREGARDGGDRGPVGRLRLAGAEARGELGAAG